MPTIAAALLIAVELGGGILLIFGLFTRVAAALLAVDMLGAMVTVHLPHGFFLPEGIEFTLVLAGASLALAGLGAGPLSLDRLLWGRRESVDGQRRYRTRGRSQVDDALTRSR